MSNNGSWIARAVRRFFRAAAYYLGASASAEIPEAHRLRASLEEMREELRRAGDATALAMSLADERHRQLQDAVEEAEALERQAGEFLSDGREDLARRSMALKLKQDARVEELSAQYSRLQEDAERQIEQYQGRQHEYERRAERLPDLADQAQMLRLEERAQITSGAAFEEAGGAFDGLEREMRIRRRQAANRQALENDPGARLDREIRESMNARKLDEAMEALRMRAGVVVDAEFEEVPVTGRARALLEAPRFRMLTLPQAREPQPARVLVEDTTDEHRNEE